MDFARNLRRSRDLLEPDAVKVARPVLRGPRRSNASGLPAELSHAPAAIGAAFDDPNLIASAGLVPLVALAEAAGLSGLVSAHVWVPTDKGANGDLKTMSLVAGMCAGADSIQDMSI